MMTTKSFVTVLFSSCLLISLSSPASSDDVVPAPVRDAISRNDPAAIAKYYEETSSKRHEIVAEHYENAAREIQGKILEQKQLREHYQNKSYFYGKAAPDLQAHADALIRQYELTAKVNLQEAAVHRQLASKLKENSNSNSASLAGKSGEATSLR
jgi:hypothetical protein